MNHLLISRFYLVCFTLFVLFASASSIKVITQADVVAQIRTQNLDDFLTGKTAKYIENQYDKQFSLKQFGINFWAAFDYLLFNEGKKGLVIGNHGWMFTIEELRAGITAESSRNKNLSLISQTKRHLSNQGIELLVVPVPAKARVYAEFLSNKVDSPLIKTLYDYSLDTLKSYKIAVTDSITALRHNYQNKPLFLRTDTHWTPEGAQLVANQVARDVRNNFHKTLLPLKPFITEKTSQQPYKGDLLKFLPIDPWFEQVISYTDEITLYETYAVQPKELDSSIDALFMDVDTVSVVLVGTSYSANSRWNFAGALKQALSTDVINLAEEGNGPFFPMVEFLRDQLPQLPDVKLVIWEIPERYLLVDYPDAYNAFSKLESTEREASGYEVAVYGDNKL